MADEYKLDQTNSVQLLTGIKSERFFVITFAIFSFSILSEIVPTGLIVFFSFLSFVAAIIVIKSRMGSSILSPLNLIFISPFIWLSITCMWGGSDFLQSLEAIFEYRFYILTIVFSIALSFVPGRRVMIENIFIFSIALAVVFSYLLYFSVIDVQGAKESLKGRIFHGFIVNLGVVLLLGKLVVKEKFNLEKIVYLFLIIFFVANIFFIERGRTAYITFYFLICTFLIFSLTQRSLSANLIFFPLIGSLVFISLLSSNFLENISLSLSQVNDFFLKNDQGTSIGKRLVFYSGAFEIAKENVFFGVGLSGLDPALADAFNTGVMGRLTDNVHSEIATQYLAGGLIGLAIFFGSLSYIVYAAYSAKNQRIYWLVLGCLTVLLISGIFNSVIKDFGEKHAFLVVFSLVLSELRDLREPA